MKQKKVGKATQDMSGGYLPKNGFPSVKTSKDSGRTHTSSVASPSSLKTGTKGGRGQSMPCGTAKKGDKLTHTPSNKVPLGKA